MTELVLQPSNPPSLMLDEMQLAVVARGLKFAFPTGPRSSNRPTREMVEATIYCIRRAFEMAGSPVRVQLEADRKTVRGVVIWTGKSTSVFKLALADNLARVNGEPIYLAHAEGVTNLMNAIVAEIELALALNDRVASRAAAAEKCLG